VSADDLLVAGHLSRQLAGTGIEAPHVGVLGSGSSAEFSGRIPIQLTAAAAVLGPMSATRPCGQCVRLRWERLRPATEQLAIAEQRASTRIAPSPYLTPFALEAILQLWLDLRTRPDESEMDIAPVYRLDLVTLAVERTMVLTDPDCPSCGPPVTGPPVYGPSSGITLVSRKKHAAGAARERALRDYDLPVAALANPLCGAVCDEIGLGLTSPTTSPGFGTFRVRNDRGVHDVLWTGQTSRFDDSTTAGLLEGLERYAGLRQRREGQGVVESLDNLGDHALDPRECGMYTAQFYRDFGTYEPFDPAKPIPWVHGHSLRDDRTVLVPRRLAYYGESSAGDAFVDGSSNGCAIGSSIEEAILHGMLELVERDAAMLAWYSRAALPEIDPGSCADPAIRFMIDRVRLSGFDVRLFDCRIDLPIPVVLAVAVRREEGPGLLTFATGASLTPEGAIRSALSEVASYAPDMPGRVTARLAEVEAMATDFGKVVDLMDHSLSHGLPAMAAHSAFLLENCSPRPMAALYDDEPPRAPDLLADLTYCRDQLVAAGFDVVVVDQSTPEQHLLGLRTARVLVPGLLPIDFGWHKQRAPHMPRLHNVFQQTGTAAGHVPHPYA
jgi:ribosomal protein S12 methylthiotransferase accessory factor